MPTNPTAPSRGRRLAATAALAAALLLVPALPALADGADGPDASQADAQAVPMSVTGVIAATPATLTEDELDTVVGCYGYQGEVFEITARAAIEDTTSLAAVRNADGTYTAPTADMILSYARNRILAGLVQDAGIEVTDEELADYAERNVGTSDFATIADYYQMDEEQARGIVREAAGIAELRDAVVGSIGDAPQPPTAPSDGDTATATAEYGSYVLGLVGDAWDGASQTWASTDSVYYQALAGTDFDGATASYQTAQTAYYAAYSLYQQQASEQRSAWTEYVNGYLAQASVSIGTLRS